MVECLSACQIKLVVTWRVSMLATFMIVGSLSLRFFSPCQIKLVVIWGVSIAVSTAFTVVCSPRLKYLLFCFFACQTKLAVIWGVNIIYVHHVYGSLYSKHRRDITVLVDWA